VIRTIRPTDLVALVAFEGRSLPNQARVRAALGRTTERPMPVAAILDQWLPLQGGHSTWVAVEGFSIHGLISARLRAGRSAWEVDWLVVDGTPQAERAALELLEQLGRNGAEAGVERVFLRLPHGSPLLETARRAGFFPYVTETLVRWEPGPRPAAPVDVPLVAALRPKTKADEYGIFRLYNQAVPETVRRAEGIAFREWRDTQERTPGRRREWVAEQDGRILAWVRVSRSRAGGVFDVTVHPDAAGDTDHVVRFALSQLDRRTPAFCLAPDHQPAVCRALLEELDGQAVTRYTQTVKFMAVPAPVRALAPIRV
jgi:hypothetical protein